MGDCTCVKVKNLGPVDDKKQTTRIHNIFLAFLAWSIQPNHFHGSSLEMFSQNGSTLATMIFGDV